MAQFAWPTCPDDVRSQIDALVEGFRRVVGDHLISVYLHGSLAMGCFNPRRSDVDLLVVTLRPLDSEAERDLAELVLATSRHPVPVEMSVMSAADLSPWRHPTPFDWHYSETWRDRLEQDLDSGAWRRWSERNAEDDDLAAHITVTRERGVCLFGPPATLVLPAVPSSDYLDSVLGDVLSPVFGLTSDLSNAVYVLLNGCRTLAYLQTGRVLSKDEGGVWALTSLPSEFRDIIAAALHAYRNLADSGELSAGETAVAACYLHDRIAGLTRAA